MYISRDYISISHISELHGNQISRIDESSPLNPSRTPVLAVSRLYSKQFSPLRRESKICFPLHTFIFHRDTNGSEEADLTEPLVTFPDPDTPPPATGAVTLTGGAPSQLTSLNSLNNLHSMSPQINMSNISNMTNLPAGQETMKFEQKKMTSASKTKVSFGNRDFYEDLIRIFGSFDRFDKESKN